MSRQFGSMPELNQLDDSCAAIRKAGTPAYKQFYLAEPLQCSGPRAPDRPAHGRIEVRAILRGIDDRKTIASRVGGLKLIFAMQPALDRLCARYEVPLS